MSPKVARPFAPWLLRRQIFHQDGHIVDPRAKTLRERIKHLCDHLNETLSVQWRPPHLRFLLLVLYSREQNSRIGQHL